jgi:hypothetical protein
MSKPVAWMLRLQLPNFNASQILFCTFSEAIAYKNNQELLYRRVKYSEPIPLYSNEEGKGNKKSFIGYVNDKIEKLFTCNV